MLNKMVIKPSDISVGFKSSLSDTTEYFNFQQSCEADNSENFESESRRESRIQQRWSKFFSHIVFLIVAIVQRQLCFR